jgi:hypothetical protein
LPEDFIACCRFGEIYFPYIVPRWDGRFEDCRTARDASEIVEIVCDIWRERPEDCDAGELYDWLQMSFEHNGIKPSRM